MSKTFTKNIPVNEILHLGEHLEYKEGQVISITMLKMSDSALHYLRCLRGKKSLRM